MTIPAQPAPGRVQSAWARGPLRAAIEAIVLAFPGYGYRRVAKALQREGLVMDNKRVLRLMRAESLLCQLKRRWVLTTDSSHELLTYPNLVKDPGHHRSQPGLGRRHHLRPLADQLRLPGAILDAFSRKVVDWAFSRWIDTSLTLQALDRALATRPRAPGLIHHSDQGVSRLRQ